MYHWYKKIIALNKCKMGIVIKIRDTLKKFYVTVDIKSTNKKYENFYT